MRGLWSRWGPLPSLLSDSTKTCLQLEDASGVNVNTILKQAFEWGRLEMGRVTAFDSWSKIMSSGGNLTRLHQADHSTSFNLCISCWAYRQGIKVNSWKPKFKRCSSLAKNHLEEIYHKLMYAVLNYAKRFGQLKQLVGKTSEVSHLRLLWTKTLLIKISLPQLSWSLRLSATIPYIP